MYNQDNQGSYEKFAQRGLMRKSDLVLGYYQNFLITSAVLRRLEQSGFYHCARIHRTHEGEIRIDSPSLALWSRIFPVIVVFLGLLCLVSLFLFPWFATVISLILLLFVSLISFARLNWFGGVSKDVIARYKNSVIRDETLLIVQVDRHHAGRVMKILREVETDQPISFLIKADCTFDTLSQMERLPTEPLTTEQLKDNAVLLAQSLQSVGPQGNRKFLLLNRLKESEKILHEIRRDAAETEHLENTMNLSAEWLLDNAYVIQGHIENVQHDLPRKYYRELPEITSGPMSGFPRVYAIAVELIAGTAGRLNRENMITFLESYQTVTPLTIGELWALPLMLRLRLVECLRYVAIEFDTRLRQREFASFWGNRLLNMSRSEPDRVSDLLEDLAQDQPRPTPHFAEELLDHLFDEENLLPSVQKWLEEKFSANISTVIHEEQIRETSEQVLLANSITSLITLSQIVWRDIFEILSPVDKILRKDPANTYTQMDFDTRDSYRHAIEKLSRHSKKSETEIAQQVLDLSLVGQNDVTRHVGYYLIDDGRPILEEKIGYSVPFVDSLHRWMKQHASLIYLGSIALITGLLEWAFIHFLLPEARSWTGIILSVFALLPLSEIAVQIMNFLLTRLFPPTQLPKMCYETGIPEEHRTLVIVPMMLFTPDTINGDLSRLEIRYLANIDRNLCFGLISDFSDAPQPHMPEDPALLEVVVNGITQLNEKYGAGTFFLFHRERVWSPSEDAWIGWERKRGKLEWLNRYLVGDPLPGQENILRVGDGAFLKNIQYVITLDADTQLSKDKAKDLVETLSHPLNRPQISADSLRVERGYTIIQPLVNTVFPFSKSSWFARIFSEAVGIDPYAHTVSDVYQDFFGEGTYHGKGIYDLHAFNRLLSGRLPEEHVLSHDLLEGSYVKVGFASSIILLDLFPEDYLSWMKRQHRWMRGDWQIIDWLFLNVPKGKDQSEKNPLSVIDRWKILDNFRRAFMPVAMTLLLLVSWIFSAHAWLVTGLVIFVLFLPVILSLVELVFHPIQGIVDWKRIREGVYRSVLVGALLPHLAYLALNALGLVIYRRFFSHRDLLEWTTYINHSSPEGHKKFLMKLAVVSLFSLIVLGCLFYWNPASIGAALPFLILWALFPLIIGFLDQPRSQYDKKVLTTQEQMMLRQLGRSTWRFFDDFVGPQTHWLPPDNYQAALEVEVAQRTSPTNIGLWLMSVLTAYDFKYITYEDVLRKCVATMTSLNKMEHYEGHLLNWYDIQNLDPLYPKYVSTVDSGNFLASLWIMQQGIAEILSSPVISEKIYEGLQDTFTMLRQAVKKAPIEARGKVLKLKKLLNGFNADVKPLKTRFIPLVTVTNELKELLANKGANSEEAFYWVKKFAEQFETWNQIFDRYLPWMEVLYSITEEQLSVLGVEAVTHRANALAAYPSLHTLASAKNPELDYFFDLHQRKAEMNLSPDICFWLDRLVDASLTAQKNAEQYIQEANELIDTMDLFSNKTNMQFLYNVDRRVFSIGYNVSDRKLDNSYYDLLASEARTASLIAIARGDVSLDHWWALGRPFSTLYGRRVLLSWGGTMFEYLMPMLFTKGNEGSLLTNACDAAVACQIEYGKRRGIPWGISEAAFCVIDSRKIYQYRSFGVPGLGLKRGLEDDLVVSPYSTGLALMVNPAACVKNFEQLAEAREHALLSHYGYYESVDFSRQKGPKGERGVIVYAYMAHHQGMILNAINNALHNDIMPHRFHSDPRICGVESILSERPPLHPPLLSGYKRDATISKLSPFSSVAIMGTMDTPHSRAPKVNLLSNSSYSIMVTSAGGGYSHWKDFDLSRWRADTTCDALGNFCYIKDVESGEIWSTTYHPTRTKSASYLASFKADKAEFKRRDNEIETYTEIVVSPEDDAEIRYVTLANLSDQKREIELTSYVELALATHAADRSHPCFNKMFIQTEAHPEHSGILAFRRLRSPDETPIWAGHVVAMAGSFEGEMEYETDRSLFIERGRSLEHPAALDRPLTNSSGYVLDPIFSLRRRVMIDSGQRIHISFVTICAESREKALALLEKYKDLHASHRALEMAWTHAHLELRHLRVHMEEMQLFQKLASRVLYPHVQLRGSVERLKRNRLGQSRLWGQGISGDLPIVVATIAEAQDISFIKQILIAHTFWTLRGLKVDLVILNEETTGYDRPLQDQLQKIIQANSRHSEVEKPGGVFLRSADKLPEEELTLILSVARAVLVAARGSLRQQLVTPMALVRLAPRLIPRKKIPEEPSQPLPFLELPYFNGVGGFTPDGREYAIYLSAKTDTPAPWINVMANSNFGTLVSEAGVRSTWYGNSQTNRITPWSNDPVLDPTSDAIYIRDEERGNFWTVTPSPIREEDAYRIRHGQGYTRFEHNSHGIEQDLLVFVPVDHKGGLPLRIQRVRLTNRSSRPRTLSVFAYSELVMGVDKEETQMHVISEWDSESQALFGWNRYNPDFGNCVTFISSSPPATTFSAHRTEFLGRNGNAHSPDALRRQKLSGQVGAALDPCFALQVDVELAPGEQKEVVFVLGYALNAEEARQFLSQCRKPADIESLYLSTLSYWDQILGHIQVDVPDLAINFALNRWLLYQNLSCRIWGRTAFYQSSGGFGFRDQLQDVMALTYAAPAIAREQIISSASRQFIEGDVQHWWQPPSGAGVRTRITDDLLWLPYVTAQYVRVTGDVSILNEEIPFLEGDLLTEDQHETFFIPKISKETGTLLEHCRRAINKGTTSGSHGLPLMGGGDWNDGMNRVGIGGKGESVWLAWFLIHVMNDFADLLAYSNQQSAADCFRVQAKRLVETIEASAWDGEWYRRAYFDDGTPLGSKSISEATIDSLSQSWAVISGAGDPVRAKTALQSVEKHLIKVTEKMVLLLTPPFDKSPHDPGYIMGYPPGVRENGGQYTHGSLWVPMAFARVGDGDRAADLLKMMHPVFHTANEAALKHYKIEPYVVAADIYALPGKVGHGGWTWYTGSAGWMYRVWIEEVLGFTLRGKTLVVNPTIPQAWEGFALRYRYGNSCYEIEVKNPQHVCRGIAKVEIDGVRLAGNEISLVDDRNTHKVYVELGSS
jgi:cellobiose phosphorylase